MTIILNNRINVINILSNVVYYNQEYILDNATFFYIISIYLLCLPFTLPFDCCTLFNPL